MFGARDDEALPVVCARACFKCLPYKFKRKCHESQFLAHKGIYHADAECSFTFLAIMQILLIFLVLFIKHNFHLLKVVNGNGQISEPITPTPHIHTDQIDISWQHRCEPEMEIVNVEEIHSVASAEFALFSLFHRASIYCESGSSSFCSFCAEKKGNN